MVLKRGSPSLIPAATSFVVSGTSMRITQVAMRSANVMTWSKK